MNSHGLAEGWKKTYDSNMVRETEFSVYLFVCQLFVLILYSAYI